MADSVVSEPPETKNTLFSSPVSEPQYAGLVNLWLCDETAISETNIARLFSHGLDNFLNTVTNADDVNPAQASR